MLKVLNKKCTPTRGTQLSACIDLYASEDVTIQSGETKLVGLGVCIDRTLIENQFKWIYGDYEDVVKKATDKFVSTHFMQLMLRSSLGKKGLILPNGVGVIDIDYEDEIKMIIHNPLSVYRKPVFDGKRIPSKIPIGVELKLVNEKFVIKEGDRIAQIMIQEHKTNMFGIETTDKRVGGFGSTDKETL